MVILSCNIITGSEDESKREYFTAQYQFINTSDSLDAVELLSGTYFPEDDYTTISRKNFQDVYPGDTLEIEIDSIYVGCKVQIGSEVIKEWNDSRRYWRVFILERDSVAKKADRIVQFTWPDDTTSSVEKLKESGHILHKYR